MIFRSIFQVVSSVKVLLPLIKEHYFFMFLVIYIFNDEITFKLYVVN